MRGRVSVTGTAFEQRLVLRTSGGNALRLFAAAGDSAALVRAAGLDVAVRGADTTGGLRVTGFTVVAVDGQPALDGVVARQASKLVLRTANGDVVLGNPPAALRGMEGARVWITGPPATGPNPYGVLVPAPR